MQNYDRLSILVSLVLLGLALMLIVGLPLRVIEAELLGSPIAIPVGGRLVMTLLLCALTAVGTEYIMRAHPSFEQDASAGTTFLYWILPTLITLAAAWFTPLLTTNLTLWIVGLGVTAIALSSVLVAEYRTIDPEDEYYTPARLYLNLVTYLAALFLFSALYNAKLRSALSASSMVVLALILSLALLRAGQGDLRRIWIFALISGVVLGEATWALNYWGVTGLTGGVLLMLIFYFYSGLAQQRLLDRFNRSVFIEFGVVGLAGVLLLASQGALGW